MSKEIKAMILGDAMIGHKGFVEAWDKYLAGDFGSDVIAGDFETNWDQLQYRRLEVEKQGPEIEEVDALIAEKGADREALFGLFVPVSSKVMDAMPNLRVVGVSRAGLENVNVEEATKRGILVFNVKGRNAHAVSDFSIGMMLAEARNIGRAHAAVKKGEWQKTFSNSDNVPELNGKTVGLVGYGYIGHLVAKKLSGFDVNVIVYDPYIDAQELQKDGCEKVELNDLFKRADIVSVHARLTDANKKMIGQEQFDLMKPTAIFVNTARAGLVDFDALTKTLQEKKILGAALDVFITEPLEEDNPLRDLDNVTLTTHIAGTTSDALTNSPFLLLEDVVSFLKQGDARFIVNKEVLDNDDFKAWLASKK